MKHLSLKNRKDVIKFIINRSDLYREHDLRAASAEKLRELYHHYAQGEQDLPESNTHDRNSSGL